VKIAVLGTGKIGNAVATKLVKIGHPHFNLLLVISNK
jgi:predicted dinucleotide-binding enzyme